MERKKAKRITQIQLLELIAEQGRSIDEQGRKFGVIVEEINGKLSLLMDAYAGLSERVDQLSTEVKELGQKIDLVVADLREFKIEINEKIDAVADALNEKIDGVEARLSAKIDAVGFDKDLVTDLAVRVATLETGR